MSDVFYLGVYIEIEHKAVEEYEPYQGCPNDHFLEDSSVNFCPECGEKIIEKQDLISTRYVFDYDELFEREDEDGNSVLNMDYDAFTVTDSGSPKRTFLVQNLKSGKYGRFLDEDTDYGAAPLDFDREKILEKFNIEFEDFLNVLREDAGSVSTNFGLVHWYW